MAASPTPRHARRRPLDGVVRRALLPRTLGTAASVAWVAFLVAATVWLGSVVLAGAFGARTAPDPGGDPERRPEEVKAALVYKFLRYLTWEEERFPRPTTPLSVGVVGKGAMAEQLEAVLKDKRHGRREIRLHVFQEPADVKDCHVLFVSRAYAHGEPLAQVLGRIPAQGVFVVGAREGLARAGGVLNFYLEEDGDSATVRFEINPDEAKRREIAISAGLLKLARIVRDEEDGSGRGREDG